MANSFGSPFDDKRSALAVFLSIIIIIWYSETFLRPPVQPVPQTPPQTAEESAPQAAREAPPEPLRAAEGDLQGETGEKPPEPIAVKKEKPDFPTLDQLKEAGVIQIEGPLYKTRVTSLGGRILSFHLKEHKKKIDGKAFYNLVPGIEDGPYPMGLKLEEFSDTWVDYGQPKVVGANFDGTKIDLRGSEPVTLILEQTLSNGIKVTKEFVFRPDSYLIDFKAQLSKPVRSLAVYWTEHVPETVAGSSYDPFSFTALLSTNKVESTPLVELGEKETRDAFARWLSVGDKYFMASLIAPDKPREVHFNRTGNLYRTTLTGDQDSLQAKLYLGPKRYKELKDLAFELHRNVNLGWFSFIAHPLLSLINIFYSWLGNYGLAIILLTLLIKLLFLPLTSVSFKSMKAMQELQPEMKALRERVKDPTQLNQEMMALYKKKGVNPMGGCLPIFIQIPVFFGLYNALLYSTEMRHAPFALWINDLSAPEALELFGIPVPVMILLMGASMFFQQLLTPSAMDPQQKKILMMMPVVFTIMFIVFPFPSGLVLYWLVNNLISIVQQGYLRSDNNVSPTQATLVASVLIFSLGYVLTLV